MITVMIPNNFIPERTYVVDVIFHNFLGLKYQLQYSDARDYRIVLDNGRSATIRDHFFSRFAHNEGHFLHSDNVPQTVSFAANSFTSEPDIPVLYGTGEINERNGCIECGIDLFASSFFMLTRWEEHVVPTRDMHQRFPASASLAYRFNFLNRPIVNEYVEMLWNMLVHLGLDQQRKQRNFKFILTHDVDITKFWNKYSEIKLLRMIAGDIFKRKTFRKIPEKIAEYRKVKSRQMKDPYDTFDWLMDLSDKNMLTSRFYFMAGGTSKYDNHYKINADEEMDIIRKIKSRGHVIGFHPSYNAYCDGNLFKAEKEILEKVLGQEVKEGRQHYLRFEVPDTWQLWEDNGLDADYTLSYAAKEGFRCGTCYEYPVFNVVTRKKLRLMEYPLIVMESSFFGYQSVTPEEMKRSIFSLLRTTQRYNGNFVLLWHNSSFNIGEWTSYQHIYEEVVNQCQFNSKAGKKTDSKLPILAFELIVGNISLWGSFL